MSRSCTLIADIVIEKSSLDITCNIAVGRLGETWRIKQWVICLIWLQLNGQFPTIVSDNLQPLRHIQRFMG